MAEIIRMPKMSDTMTEGVIASWLVKVGDTVSSGDILAEVETDKATMELESYDDGTILYLGVEEKNAVAVDGIIAVIGEEGEEFQSLLDGDSAAAPAEVAQEAPAAEATTTTSSPSVDLSSIAAEAITMPKMSDTMTEGVIASWLVKVGDKVESGDILAEVETDKATMELENYEDGTVLYLAVEAGNSVAVDGVIAVIGEEGTDYQPILDHFSSNGVATEEAPAPKQEAAPATQPAAAPAPKTEAAPVPTAATTSTTTGGRVKASPLAKKLAAEKGYDLASIPGSGENGRIVKRDVEAFQPSAVPAVVTATSSSSSTTTSSFAVGEESFTEEPVSQMRKVIASRLADSKFTSPHFYVTMEINMDKAIAARKSMNEIAPVKISFNDMVLKASAASLKLHPAVNAAWLGDKIRYNQHIHIGVAVAVPDGLLVPVVRFADGKSLSQISTEVKDLGQRAKDKKLQPSDWEGNTFTISNLGMFGVEEFTAIINPPDACILAVGGIKQTPIVVDGEIKVGNVMKVTLSCDHRVVDGAVAASFLKTLKQLLEDPVRILV